MAFDPSPPTDSNTDWVNVPEDIYEAIVQSVEEVPNTFYQEGDPARKKTQLKWTFVLRKSEIDALPKLEDDQRYSTRVTVWSPAYFTKHARNKLRLICSAVDKDFSLENTYKDLDDLRAHVEERGIRLMLKENDNGYMNAEGYLPSKAAAVTINDLLESGIIKVEETEKDF